MKKGARPAYCCLKKNLNASRLCFLHIKNVPFSAQYLLTSVLVQLRPSEHPAVRGGEMPFLLKLKACAAQLVTLFERLDWKTPCLTHTLANQLRSSHKDTRAFYASSIDGQSLGTMKKSWRYSFLKSAWRGNTRCSVQIDIINVVL